MNGYLEGGEGFTCFIANIYDTRTRQDTPDVGSAVNFFLMSLSPRCLLLSSSVAVFLAVLFGLSKIDSTCGNTRST